MDSNFWHQRWERREIGFHQPEGNVQLRRFWPGLEVSPRAPVLVPLSGKTPDMAWLAAQGHPVTGVELSEVAAREFFAEHGLEPIREAAGPLVRYACGALEMLVGDFFDLPTERLQTMAALYDRAALVALPPDLRRRYAERLCAELPGEARGLLISLEYDPAEMDGPPFPVFPEQVHALLGSRFRVTELHRAAALGPDDPLRKRGLTALTEAVYRLDPPSG